jgi:hypothetical protein
MFKLFVASSLLFFTPVAANAYTSQLVGLKQVHLLIEALSKDAPSCGITPKLIHDGFMYPASGAKFDVVDTVDSPTFYIQVVTLRQHPVNGCTSSISIQVYVTQTVTLNFSNTAVFGTIVLWDGSFLGSSTPETHPDQVAKDIEDLTKQFITEWNLSNKDN